MSFSIVILWLGVVLVTQFFPVLLVLFGGAYTFWIFMINALILLIFTLIIIPETKQKTLEEIQEMGLVEIQNRLIPIHQAVPTHVL